MPLARDIGAGLRRVPGRLLVLVSAVCAPALAPQAAVAQAASQTTVSVRALRGTIIDSLVTYRPLAGATVVALDLGASARTDSAGRFALDSLPDGPVRLTVYHPVLDSLGYGSPVWNLTSSGSDDSLLTLSTPSGATVHRARCSDGSGSTGLLAGLVFDAESGGPLAGAAVEVRWLEVSVAGGLQTVTRRRRVASDVEGRFELCGIPIDVPLAGEVATASGSKREIALDFRMRPLLFSSFWLDRSGEAELTTFTGQAFRDDGQALPGARISFGSPSREVFADNAGVFRLEQVPIGSLVIWVRAVGVVESGTTVAVLPRQSPDPVRVIVGNAIELAPVRIEATRAASVLDAAGFNRRRLEGGGAFITRDDIAGRGAVRLAEVFYGVPGIRIVKVGGRDVVTSTRTGRSCVPNYWVDGAPQHSSQDLGPDQFVLAQDIEGIEVYQGTSNIPAEFRMLTSGCPAVIVIWTKRRAGR